MKRLVVLTGAGMSVESGLSTFRGKGGLWEGHQVTDVASPEGWEKDRAQVLRFYNYRRAQALKAEPNRGHLVIAALEKHFKVRVITQNVDNLHERAGSSDVLHLHGSLFEKRSTLDPSWVLPELGDIREGDLCPFGSQYRPNIVWFGEPVPAITEAAGITSVAEILVVVGTSLVVYPAAGLVNYASHDIPKFIIDPEMPDTGFVPNLVRIEKTASEGLNDLWDLLLPGVDPGGIS